MTGNNSTGGVIVRRAVIFLMGVGLFTANGVGMKVWAEEKKAAAPAAPAEEQRKAFIQQVKSNAAAMNLQEVTVQVLGMQYQKELASLQQMQAVFCDSCKLDVNKFRQGKYRFDEKTGKFSEVEPKA